MKNLNTDSSSLSSIPQSSETERSSNNNSIVLKDEVPIHIILFYN